MPQAGQLSGCAGLVCSVPFAGVTFCASSFVQDDVSTAIPSNNAPNSAFESSILDSIYDKATILLNDTAI